MRKYLGLIVCLISLALGESLEAAVQIFDFTFTSHNTHAGYTDYPGTITGYLTFATIGIGILPTNVTISSAPSGLGLSGVSFDPSDSTGSFDVSSTMLTVNGSTISMIDGDHLYNLAFGKDSGTQNYLLNLLTGGITGNDDGAPGVVFTPDVVPEPSSSLLLWGGLGIMGLIARGRFSKARTV